MSLKFSIFNFVIINIINIIYRNMNFIIVYAENKGISLKTNLYGIN